MVTTVKKKLVYWDGDDRDVTLDKVYVTYDGVFRDDAGDERMVCHGTWIDVEDAPATTKSSDGGSTAYYDLPSGATTLNDLIEHKEMSFALGNIFKACYRYGEKDTASKIYDLNKIIYFAERLKAIEEKKQNA